MTTSTTPQKESPTGLDGAAGDNENFHDTGIVGDAEAQRKRFDTLAARAALKGHALQKLGSGFMISRWGHVKHCIDLDGVEALILRMEGGKQ